MNTLEEAVVLQTRNDGQVDGNEMPMALKLNYNERVKICGGQITGAWRTTRPVGRHQRTYDTLVLSTLKKKLDEEDKGSC
jgi:hypothetical protein